MDTQAYDFTNDKDVKTMYEKTGEMIGDYDHIPEPFNHDYPTKQAEDNVTQTHNEFKQLYLMKIRMDKNFSLDTEFSKINECISKKELDNFLDEQQKQLTDKSNKQLLLEKSSLWFKSARDTAQNEINLRIHLYKLNDVVKRMKILDDIYKMEQQTLIEEVNKNLKNINSIEQTIIKEKEQKPKTLEERNKFNERNHQDYELYGGKGKTHSKRRLKRKRTKKRKLSKKRKSSKKRKQSKKSRK